MKSLYVLRTGSRSAGGVAVTGTVTAGAATGCGSGASTVRSGLRKKSVRNLTRTPEFPPSRAKRAARCKGEPLGSPESPSPSSSELRSLELQIGLEPVAAALAAEAGLAVAAERRGRIEAVEGIRPDDAGAQALGHPEDARALLDRLVRRAERQHAQHRTEDLLLRDPVALRDVREDGRREPVALLRQAARRLVDLRSFVASRLHELFDLVELHARVDRADVGVLVERVADAQRLQPPLELLDQRLVDRLLHEQSRA